MAEHRQKTVNRPDDGRLQTRRHQTETLHQLMQCPTGARLLFDRETQIEALLLARLALRLTPERCRQLRLLGEEMQVQDDIADIAKGGR